ncbi:hypothetical protein LCGC14_2233540, partial [marine sediment metagenome]
CRCTTIHKPKKGVRKPRRQPAPRGQPLPADQLRGIQPSAAMLKRIDVVTGEEESDTIVPTGAF